MANNLATELRGVRILVTDRKRNLFLGWWRGEAINVYDINGNLVSHWHVDIHPDDLVHEKIKESMKNHVKEGYYPN